MFRKWLGERIRPGCGQRRHCRGCVRAPAGRPVMAAHRRRPGRRQDRDGAGISRLRRACYLHHCQRGRTLSATPRRERNKKATGGLLRKIGDRGVLVIKDVTSILSADRNTRASVLAAIREIYDGRWERNVGTDGGATLTWTGRIVIVGASTTAWDAAHAVVATMGDRFVLLRPKTNTGRKKAGRGAIRNTGDEIAMRGSWLPSSAASWPTWTRWGIG